MQIIIELTKYEILFLLQFGYIIIDLKPRNIQLNNIMKIKS